MKYTWVRLLFLLLIVISKVTLLYAQPVEKKSVLILHSYHQGYEWGDSIAKGLQDHLEKKENLSLHVEYLDALRYSSVDHMNAFEEYLKVKYGKKGFDFSLIICSDDPALQFVYSRRVLFGDTPVVFCGINNFEPALIKGMKNVTGVNEVISVEETVQVALRLRPNSRKIALISGTGITEQKNKEIFQEEVKKIPLHAQIVYLDKLEPDELRKELSRFSKDDIIFYVSYLRTPSDVVFTVKESVSFIRSSTDAAVFGFWDFLLPLGVVGGKVVHGYSQGEYAASMANKILSGVPVTTLPIMMKSPNKFMFNEKEMNRLSLSFSALPSFSMLIQREPTTVIREYHLGKHSNFFTHELFDNHGTVMMLIDPSDGTILDANKAAYEFYGYTNLNSMKISEINLLSPEQVQQEMKNAQDEHRNYFKFQHKLQSEQIHDVEVYSYPVKIAGSDVLFSIVHDVTARVRSEKLAHTRNVIIMVGSFLVATLFAVFSIVLYNTNRKRRRNEQMLQKSEERYRTLFETGREGIIVADAESGKFVQVNSVICRLLGYSSDEMLTMSPNDIHPKEKISEIQAQFALMAQNKSNSALSIPLLCKNNTVIFADITSSFIELDGKHYLVGFFNDISARIHANDALYKKIQELEYLNTLMTGRELKMIELKKEINALCAETGRPVRYELGFASGSAEPDTLSQPDRT